MGFVDKAITQASGRSVAVFVTGSATLYYILVLLERRRRRRRLGPPAPKAPYSLPWGIDFVIRGLRFNRQHRADDLWNMYFAHTGTYTVEAKVATTTIVLTAEPENIKAMLSTQFADYGKGEEFNRSTREFLGDSIFSTDGDLWHASRQLIRPQFIKDRVSDLHCFETHTQNLFRAIENGGPDGADRIPVGSRGGGGKTVDISNLFFRFALDASTDFLLGKSVDSWCRVKEPFADAFDEASEIVSIIIRSNGFGWFARSSAYRRHMATINEFINKYIERALRLSPEELATKSKTDAGYNFLHALASFTRDRTVLRDQILAVLLAGRDTTSATLSFTLYELARHPEVVAKLRKEILDTVGADGEPTYRNLKDMSYLKAVINETLRMYPAVPYNTRVALRDTTLPVGGGPDGKQPVGILEGTVMGYSTYIMQRRRDIYPPVSETFADPNEFSPDRWENWHPKGHEYVPFNAGPRICVGQQFALTEMAYVLCRMFQRYARVEGRMGSEFSAKPVLKTDLTVKPASPITVAFFEAEK